MNKTACYVRVSTDEQARHGVSLPMQEERLTAYCKMAGLEIVEIIKENGGVSAFKPLTRRPGGEVLMGLVARKEVKHVVALKLDRLFRDAEDALRQTKAWDKAGIALHLMDMGGQALNTASAMGRFFLSMAAGFAELERNLISERTRAAVQYKKSRGEHLGGLFPPFGFDFKGKLVVPNVNEQATIKRVRRWRCDGFSLMKIASKLEARGVRRKAGGKKWCKTSVSRLLK